MNKETLKEYLPRYKSFWVLFDLANGHKAKGRYLWWFDTRKDAMAHRKFQHKDPSNVRLSMPVKVQVQ